MLVVNVTKNVVLADKAYIADSFIKRLIGLLGKKELSKGQALILKNTSSIHTFWMHFSIDVLFISRKNTVVAILENIKPFRLSRIYPFSDVVELPAGTIKSTGTVKGDLIQIR